ncbi:LPXTG-motif cell wall-anchored protein [Microbacterium natoriense]|uniref:LPXTG-motif cell wall-anchored protein n=1 Tax=Microbacterium natoriense TaxID=284570 RepID=A0AAW8ESJ0_9MICO|nr:SdrD B-like domain-containing protein [Microbacterium natoriense]MDQ0646208.1 LPXTG-motif cell wall-anchored protein [Microbacterium natoriense]
MTTQKTRPRWLTASAVIAASVISLVAPATAAQAAGETLQISLSAQTGTPSWDATDGNGFDTGPDNDIIRTNDQVIYQIEVAANGGTGTGAIVSLTLPQGQEFRDVPAWCNDPVDSTKDATPTPAIPAPTVPLTSTSWTTLPQQTLTCAIGDLPANSTQFLQLPAFQRIEVPNGTVLPTAVASVSTEAVPTPVSSTDDVSMTVSAAPKWDLSKNGVNVQENSGLVYSEVRACTTMPGTCHLRVFSVLISAENGGKGTTPLTGPVSFTDLLNPDSFYGTAVTGSQTWVDAGAQADALYAPRLATCSAANFYMNPLPRLTYGGATEDNAVRNTGTIACAQPAPGDDATVTVTGTDWSLYTYPSEVWRPEGLAIPDGRAYAVAATVSIEVPNAAVTTFGTTVGTTTTLSAHNEYSALQGTALDGTPQPTAADEPWNSYRDFTMIVNQPGGFDKYFAGVGGAEGNTPAGVYIPSNGVAEGPPGGQQVKSGTILASAGQDVISLLTVRGATLANSQPGSALACDVWDNTKLQLHDGDYGTWGTYAQTFPSDGEAVWLSGSYGAPDPDYTIQYSNVADPGADDTGCRAGTWYDDPALVPGNDSALAAEGIYTAVNQVRIWTTIEEPEATALSAMTNYFSIALRVVPGQDAGAIMPNWAGVTMKFGQEYTAAELLAMNPTLLSKYDPAAHTGAPGDRLIYAPAYVRVQKSVLVNGERTELTNATGGDTVTWELAPKLSTAATVASLAQPVVLEDCLPAGVLFQNASVTPTVAQPAPAPAGASITCDSGTYLRFDIGDYVPNTDIPPVTVETRISSVAAPGTYTNTVTVQTDPADPTPIEDRTDAAQVAIQQAAGVRLEKTPLTPVVQVNPDGNAATEKNVWQIDLANFNAPTAVSDVDVIDTLPVTTGEQGSDFSGTMVFESVEVTAGTGVTVLYTSDADVISNPDDASNGADGIAWCDAPSGGNVVIGTGDCPTDAGTVTGLRFLRPGPFLNGDVVQAKVTMVATGDEAGDVFVNAVEASANGLVFNVGPILQPETVSGSTIGDFVWFDADADGVQDDGELPVAGYPVALTGTDDLGNVVSLSTTTDADGRYLFESLRAGEYTVTFDPAALQTGWAFTVPLNGVDGDILFDSDADQVTGQSESITVGAGAERLDLDAGIVVPPAPPATPTPTPTPPVVTGLAITGGTVTGWVVFAGLILLVVGGVLYVRRRTSR